MVAPKPKSFESPDGIWELPTDEDPVDVDEGRWDDLLQIPGVIVHRRNEELAKLFEPAGVADLASVDDHFQRVPNLGFRLLRDPIAPQPAGKG